jgi:hypothetical protein
MASEPSFDRRGLVGRGVVEHQVHVEVGGDLGVDLLEERQKLLRSMLIACRDPITLPLARSKAAYKLEVPSRT